MDQNAVSLKVVVGDDHPLLRKALSAVLNDEEDIEVAGEARDGEEVLALVARRMPDAVVVDAHMPRLGGLEVCRRLAVEAPGVSVVVYTGDDDLDLLEEALEAGVGGFVLKTGRPHDVAHALRMARTGQVYIDAALAGPLLHRRFVRPEQLLSKREHEVLRLLADGCTTEEAAATLFLSPATVRTYAEKAMHKLEARNRPHLVAKSIRLGLLS
jgi:DNA-binding NarL/FixJ family response regulator